MSSQDDRSARSDLPSTTGEFRAAADISASTAEFKAFASAYDSRPDQPWADGSWPAQPGYRSGSRRTVMIVAVIAAIAVVIAIVVLVAG